MAEIKWIKFKREDGTVEMRREDYEEVLAAGMVGVENIPAITISAEEIADNKPELSSLIDKIKPLLKK